MRRRRRAAFISVLSVVTMLWVWHAVQPASQADTGQGLTTTGDNATLTPPSPSPSASASAAPASTPSPAAAKSPAAARPTGRLVVVPGTGRVFGSGPLRRYIVEVEQGLSEDPQEFAAAVERTLGDPRSWGRGGVQSFQRVSAGSVEFRVVLASPRTVDRYCAPLNTNSYTSCYMNGRSVLNEQRWQEAVPWYANDLASYRQYMVNHEVGHALGHGHQNCPAPGALAPVMQQQTLGMQGCRRNSWPYP